MRTPLLTGMLAVSTLAWPVPSHAGPQSGRAGARAAVTKVTLELEEPRRALVCPATLRFRGTLVPETSGLVRYRFHADDGAVTPYFEMMVKEHEARDVVHLLRTGKAGDIAARGALRFEVSSSRGVRTAKATFAITCARETGQGVAEDDPFKSFRERYFPPGSDEHEFERRLKAYEQLRAMRQAQKKVDRGPLPLRDAVDANQCAWSSIGPTNIGGRVTHIAIDAANNQRVFLTTVGGIWRSMDGARRWQRVSDDFLSGPFASVAINPTAALS